MPNRAARPAALVVASPASLPEGGCGFADRTDTKAARFTRDRGIKVALRTPNAHRKGAESGGGLLDAQVARAASSPGRHA
jgi:hypothetical protein